MIGNFRTFVVPLLALSLAAALTACGGRARPDASDSETAQRQGIERARNLCQDLGYVPGTVDFARCAQSEYDRLPLGAPVASVAPIQPPPAAPVQRPAPTAAATAQAAPTSQAAPASQAAPSPPADAEEEDWLIRWFKRPNVCQTAACTIGW